MASSYTYRAVWSAPDERWIGICVELPNLTWVADDQGTALRGIQQALATTAKEEEA